MNDCIFCKIIAGEVPAHKIYEDEHTLAILDVQPLNPGHVLVLSKMHEADFFKLNDTEYQALSATSKIIAALIDEKIQPTKVGLAIAGWDVPHAHVHVLPMYDRLDITSKSIVEGTRATPTESELAEVANRLKI